MKFRFPRRSIKQQSPPVVKEIAYTPHALAPGTKLGEYEIKGLLSQTRGGYTYTAVTTKTDTIRISNEDELYAAMPIGAVRFEGKLRKAEDS